jgi:alkane 1-monooxygenase
MSLRAFKYVSPLIFFLLAWVSFYSHGIACYLTMVYAWVLIPLLELLWLPDGRNMAVAEEEMSKVAVVYDYILYGFVLLQVVTVFIFIHSLRQPGLTGLDKLGRVVTMGLLCGIFGINVGHELGHRGDKWVRSLAKISLMTSLYMHFFIEHNKGHHKNVGTANDPATARFGESIYRFWPRNFVSCYLDAWFIAARDARKKGVAVWGTRNEMVQAQIIQAAFVGLLFLLFGKVAAYFLVSATIGILLLQTVNYIEHYGLSREEVTAGKYGRIQPRHSWNSNHIIGRIMLFELSRHSDHHYLASRKYQLLRHHDAAPQMPTGYPGMMILSLLPPLWLYVMHRRLQGWQKDAITEVVPSVL